LIQHKVQPLVWTAVDPVSGFRDRHVRSRKKPAARCPLFRRSGVNFALRRRTITVQIIH
jgi:hypothetical protein